MNRALQCLPSFQNFLEERGFEKVKRGVSIFPLPPWTRTMQRSYILNGTTTLRFLKKFF